MGRKYRQSVFLWLIVSFLLPAVAFSETLTLNQVNVPPVNALDSSATFTTYFELRDRAGDHVPGVEAEDCSLKILGHNPKIVREEIRSFREGDAGVGALFVFPIAKNYSEDFFRIRSTLVTLGQAMDRDIDMLGILPYDVYPYQRGMGRASEHRIEMELRNVENTNVLEPNLFSSFSTAYALLANLKNVSKKYLVIITDAEGAIFSDGYRARQMLDAFKRELDRANITPIVVGYSPDGVYAMPNIDMLHRLTDTNGKFFKVEDVHSFQHVMLRDVPELIWGGYVYDVTFDLSGKDALAPGPYHVAFEVRTPAGEATAEADIELNPMTRSISLFWLLFGIGGVLVIGLGTYALVRWHKRELRRRRELLDRRADRLAREFAMERGWGDLLEDDVVAQCPIRPKDYEESDSVEICESALYGDMPVESGAASDEVAAAEALLAKDLDDADREAGIRSPKGGRRSKRSKRGKGAKQVKLDAGTDPREVRDPGHDVPREPAVESEAVEKARLAARAAWLRCPQQHFHDKFSICTDIVTPSGESRGVLICAMRVTNAPPSDRWFLVSERLTTVRDYERDEGMQG